MTSLGNLLRELRHERGLTLQALADTVGVVPTHLSEIERGRRNPSRRLLIKLATPLGVPSERLTQQDPRTHLEQLREVLERYPDAGSSLVAAAKKFAELRSASATEEIDVAVQVRRKK